jgi:hypothetical protein
VAVVGFGIPAYAAVTNERPRPVIGPAPAVVTVSTPSIPATASTPSTPSTPVSVSGGQHTGQLAACRRACRQHVQQHGEQRRRTSAVRATKPNTPTTLGAQVVAATTTESMAVSVTEHDRKLTAVKSPE